jgi:demethylmenaquinone methyltransferase/2-methoxy-6-polyprenyl-1,4-benzoquinol methylase
MDRQSRYRERYRAHHPDWRNSQEIYASLIDDFVAESTTVLDVGCGHGDFLERVYRRTHETYCIDPDQRSLDRNVVIRNLVCGKAEQMPFPDEFFNLVVSAWTVEHLDDPASAFSEARRVLKPGGISCS